MIRTQLLFLAGVASAAAGCAGANSVESPVPLGGASVEVLAEGGIAALSIRDRIDRDSRAFVHVNRRLCSQTCGAPIDSVAGTLPAATIDSLFNGVAAQKVNFKDDCGTTNQAADMMTYTVKITSDGATKTIRADDGTMPGPLREVVSAVRSATARK
jgi:hypothetical protein